MVHVAGRISGSFPVSHSLGLTPLEPLEWKERNGHEGSKGVIYVGQDTGTFRDLTFLNFGVS